MELTIYAAPPIPEDHWLREPEYATHLAAMQYAATQTHAIPALAKLTPSEVYWLYEIMKAGMERSA